MKNNIITMYELIGFIKDGKAPKNIKYNDEIFEYDKRHNYISQDGNLLFGDYIYELYYTPSTLNKIVEILPEENNEWEDIEEIKHKGKQIHNTETKSYNTLNSKEKNIFIPIINQLIKNQKYLKEKIENKD